MRGEHGQAAQERPRLVANAEHEGGAHGAVRGRRAGRRRAGSSTPARRHDQEPRPVLGDALDPVGEDLQAEPGGGARREDGRGPALATLDDRLAGARRVVGGQQRPGPGPQECVRLAERLDVRVDPLDRLEPLARQRREAQVDRDHDLAADLERELEEQVVVLAHRAVDEVLDGDDAGGGAPGERRPRRPRGSRPRRASWSRGRSRRGRHPPRTHPAHRRRRRAARSPPVRAGAGSGLGVGAAAAARRGSRRAVGSCASISRSIRGERCRHGRQARAGYGGSAGRRRRDPPHGLNQSAESSAASASISARATDDAQPAPHAGQPVVAGGRHRTGPGVVGEEGAERREVGVGACGHQVDVPRRRPGSGRPPARPTRPPAARSRAPRGHRRPRSRRSRGRRRPPGAPDRPAPPRARHRARRTAAPIAPALSAVPSHWELPAARTTAARDPAARSEPEPVVMVQRRRWRPTSARPSGASVSGAGARRPAIRRPGRPASLIGRRRRPAR